MREYLISVLKKNSFYVDLDCVICPDFMAKLEGTLKIDTGCGLTRFNIKKLGLKNNDGRQVSEYKDEDIYRAISGEIKWVRSYGVNTPRKIVETEENKDTKNIEEISYENLRKDRTICYRHKFENLIIGGYSVGNIGAKISYDGEGSSLLGMNVLKNFDIHCGTSLIDNEKDYVHKGDYILIGCLKDRINTAYLKALKEYFEIGGMIGKGRVLGVL